MTESGKRYEDDDGRTIVDMSAVERPTLMGSLLGQGLAERMSTPAQQHRSKNRGQERPWESSMTKQERRWYILGALKASLLIAAAFIAGLGAVIIILLRLWG